MNYQRVYDALIERARDREVPSVSETHHVKPKCLKGSDSPDNLVRLTPEEHYVAHQLLVKLYPGNGKLIWAAMAMTGTGNGSGNGRGGNKLYGWLRRQFINCQTGKKLSEETKQKIGVKSRERNQGANHPLFGRKHSVETRAKISQSLIGVAVGRSRMFSPEHRANLSAARRRTVAEGRGSTAGYRHTPETKAKMKAYWASRRDAQF